jgi:hypothetical protein
MSPAINLVSFVSRGGPVRARTRLLEPGHRFCERWPSQANRAPKKQGRSHGTHGISGTTFYKWKAKFGGMEIAVSNPAGRSRHAQRAYGEPSLRMFGLTLNNGEIFEV